MAEKLTLPDRLIDVHNHLAGDDPNGDQLIKKMDALNVEATVVMAGTSLRNDVVVQAAKKRPDRFVAGIYIDPRQGAVAVEQVQHYCDQGIRLVKLFPNLGYYPDDDACKPVFDKIAELGMGVLSHCGWLTPTMGVTAAYYSHPGRFEKVIRSYPETVFILAHMGGIAGFLETIMLTTRTPNTYTDFSPGQGVWVLECAAKMAASIPTDRLIWGMDCYYDEDWFTRQVKAIEKMGLAEKAEDIFRTNALTALQKMGALQQA